MALSEGDVVITASIGELFSAKCYVTVSSFPFIKPEQVILNFNEVELNKGENIQLTATILPEDTTDSTLTWNSSSENIASVSDEGLVTAVSVGEATITATCGEVSAECVITVVEDAGITSLFANPDSNISVYSVDGVLINRNCKAEDLKSLTKGIYIIVSGKDVTKYHYNKSPLLLL